MKTTADITFPCLKVSAIAASASASTYAHHDIVTFVFRSMITAGTYDARLVQSTGLASVNRLPLLENMSTWAFLYSLVRFALAESRYNRIGEKLAGQRFQLLRRWHFELPFVR